MILLLLSLVFDVWFLTNFNVNSTIAYKIYRFAGFYFLGLSIFLKILFLRYKIILKDKRRVLGWLIYIVFMPVWLEFFFGIGGKLGTNLNILMQFKLGFWTTYTLLVVMFVSFILLANPNFWNWLRSQYLSGFFNLLTKLKSFRVNKEKFSEKEKNFIKSETEIYESNETIEFNIPVNKVENVENDNFNKDKEFKIQEKESENKKIINLNEVFLAPVSSSVSIEELEQNALILKQTLENFGIKGEITTFYAGPAVAMFEFKPAKGIKLSKITALEDDLAIALACGSVRVIAPLPGKNTVGIEVPLKNRKLVRFSEIINSSQFNNLQTPLPLILGKDVSGQTLIEDLRKMPHLLVAGTTGSGKSVFLNSLIVGITLKSNPDLVKMIMVDPKMVEFGVYEGIPHLLIPPIIDAKKAAAILKWAVDEMEERYLTLSQVNSRNIESYNKKFEEKMPYIVIIVDELADLMMVARNEVEISIARLAQKARAVGIHLVIATQRPSVDVITGVIKANLPSRVAFSVSSQTDARTILDSKGAESLLGKGDMLFKPIGMNKAVRLQAPYLSEEEVEKFVEWLKDKYGNATYSQEVIKQQEVIEKQMETNDKKNEHKNLRLSNGLLLNQIAEVVTKVTGREINAPAQEADNLILEAIALVSSTSKASVASFQRLFKIGHSRAMQLMEQLEKIGVVGEFEDKKPRKVLITSQQGEEILSHFP